jgi:hypothetical protein
LGGLNRSDRRQAADLPAGNPTPARSRILARRYLGQPTRERESDALTPLAKQRKALEKKAENGDTYAIRELREHREYWYGQADTQPLLALASPLQLQALHAIAVDVRAGVESTWLEDVAVPNPPLH